MTVPVQTPIISYTTNGVTTAFSWNFLITSTADFLLTIDEVVTTSGYTLTGIGNVSGGTATFSVAPASGKRLVIRRDVQLERDTDYQTAGEFREEVVDADFDRIWQALQEVDVAANQFALRFPTNETTSLLPGVNERKGKLLGFNATTGAPESVVAAAQSAAQLSIDLAASSGAGLVGFIQSGGGAVARKVQDKARESVSLLDFIPSAEHAAISAGTSTYDCTAGVQAFWTHVTTVGGIGVIPAGDYIISARILITLGSKGFAVTGAGAEGARFFVSNTFSGSTQAFQIVGSGNPPGFHICGFSVRPSGLGSGSATIGLQVGDESPTATIIAGFNTSVIKGIFVADFANCIKVVHARLIRFEDCASWNSPAPLLITQTGRFTGDLVFDRCQFVTSRVSGHFGISLISNSVPYSNVTGYGSIAGIKFRSCDVYSGDHAIHMFASSSSWIIDIWFVDGCQIDQETNYGLYAESSNSGSSIADIHVVGLYVNETNNGGITFASTGTGGTIKGIWADGCEIIAAASAAINFFGGAVERVFVNKNEIVDCSAAGSAIVFNNTQGVVCSGNQIRQGLLAQMPYYGVEISAGVNRIAVTGNEFSQALVAPINDLSGNITKSIESNPGYNPRPQKSITVGASPFTYRNTSGSAEYVFIGGGTVSNVSLYGAFGVSPTTNHCWLVPHGKSIEVTYSLAPTMASVGA